jgi:hypothetical protein
MAISCIIGWLMGSARRLKPQVWVPMPGERIRRSVAPREMSSGMDVLIPTCSFLYLKRAGLHGIKIIILFSLQPAKGWISACLPQGRPCRGCYSFRVSKKKTNGWVVDLLRGNIGKFCQHLFKDGLIADHKTPEAVEVLDAIGRVTRNE